MKRLASARMAVTRALLSCVTMTAFSSAAIPAPGLAGDDAMLHLDNGLVSVAVDPETGAISAQSAGVTFLTEGSLGPGGAGLQVRADAASRVVSFRWPDGRRARLWLVPHSPFIHCRAELSRPTEEPALIKEIVTFRGHVLGSSNAGALRVLGCDGLTSGAEARTSYLYLAVARPSAGAGPAPHPGIVAGWLTHDRASGIVISKAAEQGIELAARSEYGALRLQPDDAGNREIIPGETFLIGAFADASRGLEAYADAMARHYNIHLPRIPDGYCTWYSDPNGGAASAPAIEELAAFARRELVPLGFDTVQIDDHWQGAPRPAPTWGPAADFTRHDPAGPYPAGMARTADVLREAGLRAGLWLMPFAWDPRTETMREHQDWFVHTATGEIRYVTWAGWCLDMTHPQARAFLHGVIHRITHEWGYRYLKLDGLWAGTGANILYPEPRYRPDELGDAVFHDPSMTPIEAYRRGLQIVREAAGPDTYLLGCNIAQNMRTLGASIGRVDGMRVGRDVSTDWNHILPCVAMGSRLYFLHDRVWHNDPDCLLVREPLTLDQARAWASWIHVSGQLQMVSEWLPGLPEERLAIYRRILPATGLGGRPLDLFESDPPCIWHLLDDRTEPRSDTVAFFNWSTDAEITLTLPTELLGIEADRRHTITDFWDDAKPAPLPDTITVTLPPTACRVFVIRPASD